MADMIFVKLFADDLIAAEELTYEEKGRLFEAVILYASTGEKPNLPGNERFVFPWMKARIDREREGIEERKEVRKKAAQSRWNKPEEDTEECKSVQTDANDASAYQDMQTDANDAIKKEERRKNKEERIKKKEESESKRACARFTPPTEEEVEDYCRENTLHVNAQRFVTFYASKGWKVGKESMKDWRAAVRGWALRDSQERQQVQDGKPKLMSSYSAEDIAAWERMEVSCGDLRGAG